MARITRHRRGKRNSHKILYTGPLGSTGCGITHGRTADEWHWTITVLSVQSKNDEKIPESITLDLLEDEARRAAASLNTYLRELDEARTNAAKNIRANVKKLIERQGYEAPDPTPDNACRQAIEENRQRALTGIKNPIDIFRRHGCAGYWLSSYDNMVPEEIIADLKSRSSTNFGALLRDLSKLIQPHHNDYLPGMEGDHKEPR